MLRITRLTAAGAALALVALVPLACGNGGGGGGTPPPETGTVSGSVSAPSGGVAGASLSLSRTGQTTRTATSTSTGGYSFSSVPTGTWTLTLTPPTGFTLAAGQSATASVNVTAGATATHNFALAAVAVPTGSVQATVLVDGAAEEGVQVRIFPTGENTAIATQTTNASGVATFTGIPAGAQDIAITVPSGLQMVTGEQARRAISITADQTTNVTFNLEEASAQPTVHTVNLEGTSFVNGTITIAVGDIVRWVNVSGFPHTITPDGHSRWSTVAMNTSGQVFEHTFDTAGAFDYFCEPHVNDGMNGVITVE